MSAASLINSALYRYQGDRLNSLKIFQGDAKLRAAGMG